MSKMHHDDGSDLKEVAEVLKRVYMDGGLYEHYTKFRNYMQEAVVDLLGEGSLNVFIELSTDGLGIGAALLAASHSETMVILAASYTSVSILWSKNLAPFF